MANLYEFQERLTKLNNRDTLNKFLFDVIKETQRIALSLQKQQLSDGQDSEGKLLGTYSRETEIISLFEKPSPRQPKREGEPYNLEWTGGFFDNMYLIFGKEEVSFWSKGESTPDLIAKHDDLFGLDDYNMPNYIKNTVLPIFLTKIRKVLQID